MKSALSLEQRDDGWWIVSARPDVLDMGPYKTKAEAQEDKRGVERTLEELDAKTTTDDQRGAA